MDWNDLKVFAAVAEAGSMSRAAATLNTVQSNVTAHIRALERSVGTRLFDRHSRGVRLTPAGSRLLPYAERMRHLLDEARRAAAEEGAPRGPLAVGALETTAAMRLAQPLADFVGAHPDVALSLRTGTTAELLGLVLRRELDGAFVCGPVDHPDLLAEPIFEERLALATTSRVGGLSTLREQPDLRLVVLRAGCSYRQRLEDLLTRRGLVGLTVMEFGTIEAIVATVAAGLGVTLLPRPILEPAAEQRRVALHDLDPEDGLVQTVFVRRADRTPGSALRAFLACSRDDGERPILHAI